MAGIAEVGAKDGKKPEKEKGDVTIYFGVFFDGTNNHRLQVLIGKKYREKNNSRNDENNKYKNDEDAISESFTLDIDTNKNFELEKGYAKALTQKKQKLEEKKEKLQIENERLEHQSKQYEDAHNSYIQRIDEYRQSGGNNSHAIMNDPDSGKSLHYQTIIEQSQKNNDEIEQINKQIEDIENKLNPKYFDDKVIEHAEYDKNDDVQTNGLTNIALLEPFYQAEDGIVEKENEYAYRIYVSGSGTDRDIIDPDNETLKGAGFGQGDTGVIQKVLDAIYAIRLKLTLFNHANSINLKFHVFGFSRGATAARNFVYNLSKADNKENLQKILNNDRVNLYEVPFLGIYDTVASVGVLGKLDSKQIRDTAINIGGTGIDSGIMKGTELLNSGLDAFHEAKGWLLKTFKCKSDSGWEYKLNDHSAIHQFNVQDLGLYATTESYQVGKVLHICAADEYRENFALVDIKSSIESNGVEMFIPGAHADVGGGYNNTDAKVKLETVPYYISPINKSLMLQGEFLYNSDGNYNTAIDSLRELGWIDDGGKNEYNNKHKRNIIESDHKLVRFYSGAILGYNYIGLHLMEEYANTHGGNVIFKKIDPRFKVPEDLEKYKERLKKGLLLKEKGTIDIRATQPVASDGLDYPKLRNKYLHFSSNYTRTKGLVHVNTPSLFDVGDAFEYRRIIYQGVSSDDKAKGKQNTDDDSELMSKYINDMTKNNILHRSIDNDEIKKRLKVQFDILRDYISEENAKAKSKLKENLSNRERNSNCTIEGYFRGEKGEDKIEWPDPNFEVGTMEIVIIPPGTIIDRYSGESGEFFGLPEFPIETRGVYLDDKVELDGKNYKKYTEHHIYIVKEPLIAIKSKVAPEGFGKLGGADQYELFFNTSKKHVPVEGNRIYKDYARDLVENGYIEQIDYKGSIYEGNIVEEENE